MNYTLRSIPTKQVKNSEIILVMSYARECIQTLDQALKYDSESWPSLTLKEFTIKTRHSNWHKGFLGGRDKSFNPYISISMNEYRSNCCYMPEYGSFKHCPVIGGFYGHASLVLQASIAHEIAHAYQRGFEMEFNEKQRSSMKAPHGDGWKFLYSILRRSLINHQVKPKRQVA